MVPIFWVTLYIFRDKGHLTVIDMLIYTKQICSDGIFYTIK